MVKPIIEVCANSAESCVQAELGGAYRVELCAAIPEGGTTPSYGEITLAKRHTSLKFNVIIRPRGGDFLYSDMEVGAMMADIKIAKELGVDGVVFGCLTANGEVDVEKNSRLINAAKGLSVTFHRAFDVCREPFVALEQIIELGFDRILTSGQQPTALEGAELISKLVKQADNRIIIMPGCGVNEGNVAQIAAATGAVEFHMSARVAVESEMNYRNTRVSMGGTVRIDEFSRDITASQRVADSVTALKNI